MANIATTFPVSQNIYQTEMLTIMREENGLHLHERVMYRFNNILT